MATTTTATQTVPPNQSLYIQNLPQKLPKEDLRRELYVLFSTYGPVLDVTALKTGKMRGQAHVLFRDVGAAAQALRACQGFEVGGREMRISYSKNRSNTLAKLTGTFGQPAATAEGAKAGALAQGVGSTQSTFAVPGAQQQITGLPAKVVSTGGVLPAKPAVPAPATGTTATPDVGGVAGTGAATGTKRPREDEGDEEEEEDGDEEMEVEDEEMEMSDDE